MYNTKTVQFTQEQNNAYIINIHAMDENYVTMKVGFFNFLHKVGVLTQLNGNRKEYKQFQAILNYFFKVDEFFGWNDKAINEAKTAAKELIKAEKKAEKEAIKEDQTNKAIEYLNKVTNNDETIINSLQYFKDKTDSELIEIINKSFKNEISKELVNDIFNAIKEVFTVNEEVKETTQSENTQQCFDVMVTYNDTTTKHSLWANNIEEARDKAYFKWIHADKREVVNPEETEVNENNQTTELNEYYIVANRTFTTYSEAEQYCYENDFDPETMIIKEVANMQPLETQNKDTTDKEPEVFHYYKETFNTYSEAYNHAIKNISPVTMVISSKHPTMTNERLQELEKEYIFSKMNMSYDDMKEYFEYISTLPETLDKQDRYYKLKSWIQRYENRKISIKEKEENNKNMMSEAEQMLIFMCNNGLEIKSTELYTYYYFKGEKVHSWLSGISIEEYYKGVKRVYDTYFNESKAV